MNVVSLELRNLRKGALISGLATSVILAVMLAFFPMMQSESMQALAGAKLDGINPILLKALGLSNLFDFTSITFYFGYVIQFVGLAIFFLLTQQAASLFIKEETEGTIEFLAAKPVSRGQIFAQKLAAHGAVTVLTVAAYFIVTAVGYLAVSEYAPRDALRESFVIFSAVLFIAFIFSSIGVLASTVMKSSKAASGVTTAIVFGTFLLGVLSVIAPGWTFLYWLSPLEWIKAEKLMRSGLSIGEYAVGLAIIAACVLGAWLRYRRKDLLIG